jgi:hypothetical protein
MTPLFPHRSCIHQHSSAFISGYQRLSAFISGYQRLSAFISVYQRLSAVISVYQRLSAVETQVFSPFSVSQTLRSGHGDSSLLNLRPLGLRTSFCAEPETAVSPSYARSRTRFCGEPEILSDFYQATLAILYVAAKCGPSYLGVSTRRSSGQSPTAIATHIGRRSLSSPGQGAMRKGIIESR